MFLISSIRTINIINAAGVPRGTKCANISLVEFNQPKTMWPNHNGKAKDTVKTKCLEDVKIYGNNPIKLFSIIVKNKEMGISRDPGVVHMGIIDLNSFSTKLIILAKIFVNLLPESHALLGRASKVRAEAQFQDKFIIALGSNTENKLDIKVSSRDC